MTHDEPSNELHSLRKRVAELEGRLASSEELREQLKEYKLMTGAVLNSVTDSLFVVDGSGIILAVNDVGAGRTAKSSPEALTGRNVFELLPPDVAAERRRWLEETLKAQKPLQFKDFRDGIVYGHRLIPYFDPTTNAARVAVFSRDITDSEKALKALRESESRYRAILEDQTELICRYLPDGRLSYVNEAYARYYGKDRQDLINTNYAPNIPEEDWIVIRESINSLSPERPVVAFEHRIIRDNGEINWQYWTHRAIYDAQGNLTEYQAVGRDITKRRIAQAALTESESRYRSLFEDSPISLWEQDFSKVHDYIMDRRNEGIFDFRTYFRENPEAVHRCAELIELIDINKATLDLFGASDKSQMLGSITHVFTEQSYELLAEELAALAEGKRQFKGETVHRALDGREIDVEIYITAAPGHEESLGKILVSVLDVTEKRKAERELERNRAFLRLVIDTVPNPIFVKDRSGVFTLANRAMADLYGTTPEEMIGRNGADFNPHEDEISIFRVEDLEVLDSQRAIFIPQRVITNAQGERRWFSTTKLPLGGDLLLGVAVDITERKEAEAERSRLEKHFRQAQKMQALGTLAGGIAHDFNNMIFAMLGFVRLALKMAEEGSKVEEYLKQIQSAGLRASDLVRQILTFSRRTEQEKKPVHLSMLIKEISKMLRATFPSTIDISVEVAPEVADDPSGTGDVIYGDATQIHQVIMNLCTNAAHAMTPKGGNLKISLAPSEITPERARDVLEQNPGRFLEITVKDTGHGIDPEILEQIYDPFFTTKAPGEGTGMGLAVVHGIVKSHGGTVHVDSSVGKGTVFRVLLPKPEETSCDFTPAQVETPSGNERILFIDDEPLLVQMAGEMLSQLGYRVTALTSPDEALESFVDNPDQYDVVITDQTMPGMTGTAVAKKILNIKPSIPIILLTGYSESVTPENLDEFGIDELIMKPVVEEQLAQTIRHVLDSKHRGREHGQIAAG